MSAAAMIPLAYKPPQIENPAQVGLAWQNLRNAAVQGDAAKLQLADMQQRQQEQKALSQSYMDAHGDMDKFFSNAAQAGVRPQTLMPIQKQWSDAVTAHAQADLTKTAASEARANDLNGALMGKFSTLDDSGKRTWKDPTPDDAGKFFDEQFRSGRLTQQQLDDIKSNHPNNMFSGADLQAYSSYLNTGTQLNQQAIAVQNQQRMKAESDARIAADKARASQEQSAADFNKLRTGQLTKQDWASNLSMARTPDAYKAIRDQMPADLKAKVPDETQFDPKTTPDVILRWGLTPEQRTQETEANARLEESRAYHEMVGTGALARGDAALRNADTNASNPKQTPAQRSAVVQQLATTAYNNLAQSDAFKGKAPGYHDVISSVLDQNNYVGETNAPEMAANRLAVAQYLGQLEKQGLDVTKLGQAIDKGNTKKGGAIDRLQAIADQQNGRTAQRAAPTAPPTGGRGAPTPPAAAPPQQAAPTAPPTGGRGAPTPPIAAPPQPAAPRPSPMGAAPAGGAPKSYTVGKKTYTEGQPITGKNGAKYIFRGLDPNGKILAEPVR